MSIQAISLRQSVAPQPTIMVATLNGYNTYDAVSQVFRQISAHTPVKQDFNNGFLRDAQVVGLNGIWLLTHPIEKDDDAIWDEAEALLPESSRHFVESDLVSYGKGFNEIEVDNAMEFIEGNDIPYRRMRSPIEGGNCYVFFDSQGNPKAIVGIHSVVLTLIALEEQRYFDLTFNKEFVRLIASIDLPSDEAIRRARNWQHHKDLDGGEAKGNAKYLEKLMAPVIEEDREKYRGEARVWQAKEIIARRMIAEDLSVPLESIAFVPQKKFHIDMEMFVAPNKKDVFIDRSSRTPEAIEELQKVSHRIIPVDGIHILEEKGWVDDESDDAGIENGMEGKELITFMNGVFATTHYATHFITNAGCDTQKCLPLYQAFRKQIEDAREPGDAGFVVSFVPNMGKLITKKHGGIHCLSREYTSYTTILDIILLGYLAGEPVPEHTIRAWTKGVLNSLDIKLIDRQEESDDSRRQSIAEKKNKRKASDTGESGSHAKKAHAISSSDSEMDTYSSEDEESAAALSPTAVSHENYDPEWGFGYQTQEIMPF